MEVARANGAPPGWNAQPGQPQARSGNGMASQYQQQPWSRQPSAGADEGMMEDVPL